MDPGTISHIKDASNTINSIYDLSKLLNTGLDNEALSICIRLCEAGVNPEVLAALVRDLQNEVRAAQSQNGGLSHDSRSGHSMN